MIDVERTLVLIKPDGIQRSFCGRILQRFEDVGLKFVGMRMVWADKSMSQRHYSEHTSKSFYPGLENMLTEGPVLAIAVEGVQAVEVVRKMVGGTEPKSSNPGTIRGDFAHHSYAYTDQKGTAIKNLIHASATPEEAKKEVGLWFNDSDIHSYKTVHELHVF